MPKEPTYEEALAHFRVQDIYWKVIVKGIQAKSESYYQDLKRNMNTPNCNNRADDKVLGAMVACDDIAWEFESHGEPNIQPEETQSH